MELNYANGIGQMSESEQRFESLIRQASVGIIVLTGEEMRVEVVNDMYGQLIGRTPEEIQGKELFSIIPEAEEHFRPIIDGVRLSGKPLYLHDHPYTVLDKNGTEKCRYLNLVCQPYSGTNGYTSGVMVLCHDVTEQVESKKRTQEAEAKLRVAIESGDLGTYELDMHTGKLTLSNRFKEIWGVQDDLSREFLASKVHPDDQSAREQAHLRSLVTGQLFYEARIKSGDQKYKWVRNNGRVLFDTNGKPITLVGVVQDISNQKDYTEQLDKLVQERTELL
ncbi:MAG TPA: PAS domain S-box protein, partial [Sphingobacteriaceae bacterium]